MDRQTSGLCSFHTGNTNCQFSTLENHIDLLTVITCLISLLWGEKCKIISNSFELAVFSEGNRKGMYSPLSQLKRFFIYDAEQTICPRKP